MIKSFEKSKLCTRLVAELDWDLSKSMKDDSQRIDSENDILADVEIPGPMTVEDEDLDDSTTSNFDIMNALKIVRKFAQINTLNKEVNSLSKIETTLINSIINSKKQTEITHYFK